MAYNYGKIGLFMMAVLAAVSRLYFLSTTFPLKMKQIIVARIEIAIGLKFWSPVSGYMDVFGMCHRPQPSSFGLLFLDTWMLLKFAIGLIKEMGLDINTGGRALDEEVGVGIETRIVGFLRMLNLFRVGGFGLVGNGRAAAGSSGSLMGSYISDDRRYSSCQINITRGGEKKKARGSLVLWCYNMEMRLVRRQDWTGLNRTKLDSTGQTRESDRAGRDGTGQDRINVCFVFGMPRTGLNRTRQVP
ncbi:hypothetical protein OSB04_000298 [Centaurea solstitialis]|uniref:Uncharacterized protein n=1 Tax=Centaurea solstitialis TaxID=347529 RepID=A0AA38WKE4_9ASTR|nr:hypothetical protein OSB04_000298 [Centaurea solstitialis]